MAILGMLALGQGCGGGGGGAIGEGGTGAVASGAGGTGATGGAGGPSAKFSFTLNPTALMLPAGASESVVVTINRDLDGPSAFNEPIMFSLEASNTIMDSGVAALFSPNPAKAGSTTATVSVAASGVADGSYTLDVVGRSGSGASQQTYAVSLPLIVPQPASTLLVDNDQLTASSSDALFPMLLAGEGQAFNTFVAPGSAHPPSEPGPAELANYSTVVWYTGDNYGGVDPTLSAEQEASLEAWLDAGGHTLLIFSQDLIYDIGNGSWSEPEPDAFLADYVGAAGDADDGDLLHISYKATGVADTPFAGELFNVVMNAEIGSSADVINPDTGTDALVTVIEDPADSTGEQMHVPAVVGHKNVGAAKTSQVVYVGIPIEDIVTTTGPAGTNSPADFFHAVLVYAGLVTQ